MAKQSIFGRISQLMKANVNALIDQAEDPEKMLDQMVRDFTNNIADAESAIAETIGNLRMLEDDHKEDVEAAAEWGQKALAASKQADTLPLGRRRGQRGQVRQPRQGRAAAADLRRRTRPRRPSRRSPRRPRSSTSSSRA